MSVTLTFEPEITLPKVSLLTLLGLTLSLIFDLLTSQSNQSSSVPNCSVVANLVIFRQVVLRHRDHRLYDDTQMDCDTNTHFCLSDAIHGIGQI